MTATRRPSDWRVRLDAWWQERCARYPWLARWSSAWSGVYDIEQHAALHGQLAHRRDVARTAGEGARFALRRGVHRLEKGLIMRPRRAVFGEAYIGETVAIFAHLVQMQAGVAEPSDPLLTWAADVLGAYFAAVASTPTVEAARDVYANAVPDVRGATGRAQPHPPETTPPPVGVDPLLALVRRRRSVRWFLRRRVPRAALDAAVEAARWAPSACNRQPFEFRIFDDPALVRMIGALPMGTEGFVEQFPALVVVVGKLRAFAEPRDRHVIYIDASLATMSFLLALESQGIGSCVINWPEVPHLERRMQRMLDLAADERPIVLIALGYPDPQALVPCSQKKTLAELRSYNAVAPAARAALPPTPTPESPSCAS